MDDAHQRWLNAINARGMEIAGRLAALKAGQDIRLEDIVDLGYQAGLLEHREKEKKLREMLDAINRARTRCLEGSLLKCEEGGAMRSPEVVNERPWEICSGACEMKRG